MKPEAKTTDSGPPPKAAATGKPAAAPAPSGPPKKKNAALTTALKNLGEVKAQAPDPAKKQAKAPGLPPPVLTGIHHDEGTREIVAAYQIGELGKLNVRITAKELARMVKALPLGRIQSPDDVETLSDAAAILEAMK